MKIPDDDNIPLFLSFCIEQYKHEKAISGKDALQILQNSGALTYLEDNYEILHTQSPQWIMEEIDGYIKKQKEK